MTVNLGEQQVGYDAATLGFPSIWGCIAIVAVLPGGLYGYHSYGGSAKDAWPKRAPKFKEYIESKGGVPSQATRLYGVTHVDAERGYSGVAKEGWKAELKAFANALGTTCRISGYNLDDAIRAGFHKKGSAYVEFRKAGTKCNVWVQSWKDVTYTQLTAANNPWGDNIKTIKPGNNPSLEDVSGDIYNPINPTNALKQISKTKLQG